MVLAQHRHLLLPPTSTTLETCSLANLAIQKARRIKHLQSTLIWINPGISLDEQIDLLPYDPKWEFPQDRLILLVYFFLNNKIKELQFVFII